MEISDLFGDRSLSSPRTTDPYLFIQLWAGSHMSCCTVFRAFNFIILIWRLSLTARTEYLNSCFCLLQVWLRSWWLCDIRRCATDLVSCTHRKHGCWTRGTWRRLHADWRWKVRKLEASGNTYLTLIVLLSYLVKCSWTACKTKRKFRIWSTRYLAINAE